METIDAVKARNTASPLDRQLLEWLAGPDTGESSRVMAFASVGLEGHLDCLYPPYSSEDLGRCIRLVERVDGVKWNFDKIRSVSKGWRIVIDHWDELKNLYEREVEGKPNSSSRYMPETNKRLLELVG